MASPMAMNLPGAMVLGGVVVGMRVDERSAQGRSLDGQRERDGDDLPHVSPLLVTSLRRVKGSRHLRA